MRGPVSLARDLNPWCSRMNIMITYAASGAVAAGGVRGMGLSDTSPPTSPGTGILTITLDRPVKGGIMGFMGGWKGATEANLTPVITSDLSKTTGVITIETRVAAGTATNPTSGDILWLEFVLDEQGLPF